MNNLTKAIEEAMMDLYRWEYVHRDFIESPAYLNSTWLKDHVTGIVFEVMEDCILYRGRDLKIDKRFLRGFFFDFNDYDYQHILSNLYKAYGVEE